MASSLPFGDMLETAVIPKLFAVKMSLFHRDPCTFTVINYRDQKTHQVTVLVTSVSDPFPEQGHSIGGKREFRLKGKIIKIDDQEWGPPANGFDARYYEDVPRASGFEIHGGGDPLPTF